MRPDVDAYDIEQTVAGALRQSDQLPGQQVHLFDRQILLDGQLLNRGAEERADAVGNEVGCVLADHDAFAQVKIAEFGDEGKDFGIRFRPGNYFRQMQIPGRIEKVSAKEVLAKFRRVAFSDAAQRNAARV